MDPSAGSNGRRPRRRGGQGQGPAPTTEGRGGGGNNTKRRRKRRRFGGSGEGLSRFDEPALEPLRDSSSVLGARVPQKRERQQPEGPPDAFSLFCSYHLGVTPEDGYQKPSLGETARRFGVNPDELKGLLTQHGLDPESVARSKFDLEGARLDIRVAPEGISRLEIAREHFAAYQECLGHT